MTNTGTLGGMWRCTPRMCSQSSVVLWQVAFRVARPLGAEACSTSWVEKRADAATGHGRLMPPRGGVRKAPALTPTSRAPLILRPRAIIRRGHMPRASCGLRVPPLVCLRLDPDENRAPERVELS
jgi:hypothetical protein